MLKICIEQGKENSAAGGGYNFKEGGQCRPHWEREGGKESGQRGKAEEKNSRKRDPVQNTMGAHIPGMLEQQPGGQHS